MHTIFPTASSSNSVSKLSMREDGDTIEKNSIKIKWFETQYFGPFKVTDTEDSKSECEDEKWR